MLGGGGGGVWGGQGRGSIIGLGEKKWLQKHIVVHTKTYLQKSTSTLTSDFNYKKKKEEEEKAERVNLLEQVFVEGGFMQERIGESFFGFLLSSWRHAVSAGHPTLWNYYIYPLNPPYETSKSTHSTHPVKLLNLPTQPTL